jgi:hypothetical protein
MAVFPRPNVLPLWNEHRDGQYARARGTDDVEPQKAAMGNANPDCATLQKVLDAVALRFQIVVLLRLRRVLARVQPGRVGAKSRVERTHMASAGREHSQTWVVGVHLCEGARHAGVNRFPHARRNTQRARFTQWSSEGRRRCRATRPVLLQYWRFSFDSWRLYTWTGQYPGPRSPLQTDKTLTCCTGCFGPQIDGGASDTAARLHGGTSSTHYACTR